MRGKSQRNEMLSGNPAPNNIDKRHFNADSLHRVDEIVPDETKAFVSKVCFREVFLGWTFQALGRGSLDPSSFPPGLAKALNHTCWADVCSKDRGEPYSGSFLEPLRL